MFYNSAENNKGRETMTKPEKAKPSGPAVLMYCIIGICALAAAVSFTLYYGNFAENVLILWVGIVTFTITYHLWMRIIMGNVSKLFKVSYKHLWFKENAFEKKLYTFLKVKKWKRKALTYNPELYSVKDRTLEEIADTTAKSELDHWINEIISIVSIFFVFLWGCAPAFIISAVAAMLFDAQFIVVQRYNRPIVLRLMSARERIKNKNNLTSPKGMCLQ